MRPAIARTLLLAGGLAAVSNPAPAADFFRGLEAYERGDYAEALREWLPLAEQGDVESQYRVARMYYHGEGAEGDAEAALWYRRAAEGGHAISQNNLGLMLEEGRGLDPDLGQAARWYAEAAKQGVMTAQANLARLYEEGRGVPEDPEQAARWYRRAAKAGHPDSQYRLGRMFDEGRGVPRDRKKAVKWYRKAADNGHNEARDALARGRAVASSGDAPTIVREQDREIAPVTEETPHSASEPAIDLDGSVAETEESPPEPSAPLAAPAPSATAARAAGKRLRGADDLRELAERGDVEAQYRLARKYMRGEGVPQDLQEAGRWMREAAEAGHALAGYRVAFMYLRAVGVSRKKDFVQAYRWFELSARRGVGDAAGWRDKIAPKLSEAELAEAERLVRSEAEE